MRQVKTEMMLKEEGQVRLVVWVVAAATALADGPHG
jgi:hypothetical protein